MLALPARSNVRKSWSFEPDPDNVNSQLPAWNWAFAIAGMAKIARTGSRYNFRNIDTSFVEFEAPRTSGAGRANLPRAVAVDGPCDRDVGVNSTERSLRDAVPERLAPPRISTPIGPSPPW